MAKFCTNCGAALAEDKKFCTECGAAVTGAPAREESESTAAFTGAAGAAVMAPPREAPPIQPQQPAGYRAAPTYGEAPPAAGSKYEPMTAGGFIGAMLLMCIPVIGQILAIVWALGGCRKINKRNLARATLILTVIGLIISLILGFAAKALLRKVGDVLEEETGISLTGEKDREEGGGLLGGLFGLIGGESADSGANEELEELENLLGDLGQDNGELSGTIDTIEDINAEAEAKNNGWPKSLRKYPGGTAVATASYRTEISGTTAEEMMEWIEDLKSDGFVYQDFYDFGMTEEDMLSVNGSLIKARDLQIV